MGEEDKQRCHACDGLFDLEDMASGVLCKGCADGGEPEPIEELGEE